MKRKLDITLFTLLLIILISVLTGALIVLSYLLVGTIKAAEQDYIGSVVGSLGNIIGGFIGGVVAYIVAAYQVQKTYEFDKSKGQAGNYATLRLVKVEIDTNHRMILNNKENYLSGKKDYLKFISSTNWEKCSTLIGQEVSDETVKALSSLYNRIRLLNSENLPAAVYEQLIVDLASCSSTLESELRKLRV